jgi:hypothetical protein
MMTCSAVGALIACCEWGMGWWVAGLMLVLLLRLLAWWQADEW